VRRARATSVAKVFASEGAPDARIHDGLHHEIEMCHDCGHCAGEVAPPRDSDGSPLSVPSPGMNTILPSIELFLRFI
jgi:hypothetical protein